MNAIFSNIKRKTDALIHLGEKYFQIAGIDSEHISRMSIPAPFREQPMFRKIGEGE